MHTVSNVCHTTPPHEAEKTKNDPNDWVRSRTRFYIFSLLSRRVFGFQSTFFRFSRVRKITISRGAAPTYFYGTDSFSRPKNAKKRKNDIKKAKNHCRGACTLDANKSAGPDKVPNKLLKMCALLIANPLCKLFNKSLQAGIFPLSWKKACVTPIFKQKGSRSDPTNYRPTSHLPNLSKTLEKLVFNKMSIYLSIFKSVLY